MDHFLWFMDTGYISSVKHGGNAKINSVTTDSYGDGWWPLYLGRFWLRLLITYIMDIDDYIMKMKVLKVPLENIDMCI